MTNYIFDNAAERETAERFASLESLHDPHTIRHLLSTGVAKGWRCLEVGGGSGSISRWLADRVGPEGHVVATDIDPRFLASSGRANLEIRRHDVGTDPLPESAFNLIHSRLVLIHVPQREASLARLVNSLTPGGWLLIEDYDPIVIDRTFPIENDENAMTAQKCLRAMLSLMESRGLDMSWGSSLYQRFVAAGLVDVGMQGHTDLWSGGSPGARLDKANLSQIRDEALQQGFVTHAEIDRMLLLLDNPEFRFRLTCNVQCLGPEALGCLPFALRLDIACARVGFGKYQNDGSCISSRMHSRLHQASERPRYFHYFGAEIPTWEC